MAEATQVDLRKLKTGVINLEFQSRRRHRARNALTRLGLDFSFIEGIADKPRHLGCSQSHLKAIETLRGGGAPFLVLEDDAIPTPFYIPQIEIPPGADLLYLGHSPYGWSRVLNGTPEITGQASVGFLRVHSMLAAHAIIYVTQAGVDAVAASIRRSISGQRSERHDIGLCDLQQTMNVQATIRPLFCQSGEVQGAKKRDQRKELEDFVSMPRAVGDLVVSANRQLLVAETQSGRLSFRLEGPDPAA